MKALLDFIKYNNAFPLVLIAVLFVGGAVLAANPDIRESVLPNSMAPTVSMGTMETSAPADTTLLLNTDLQHFNFNFKTNAVRQDTSTYYIDYSYQTLEIANNIWTTVSKSKTLKIAKELLGGRDLGLYAADQIGQVMAREVAYLSEVQQKLLTPQTTGGVKKYASLVGKQLSSDGTFGDYKPIVKSAEETETPPAVGSGNKNQLIVDLPENSGTFQSSTLTKEEIRSMIVDAVARFLSIEEGKAGGGNVSSEGAATPTVNTQPISETAPLNTETSQGAPALGTEDRTLSSTESSSETGVPTETQP